MRKIILVFNLVVFLLQTQIMAQQTKDDVNKLFEATEDIYSTDDLLVNGQFYIPTHFGVKGNPYFKEDKFIEGSLVIRGRQFDSEYLKYDLENQRLILRTALQSGKYVTILLNPEMVDSFTMGDLTFINANHYFNQKDFHGYYVLVYGSEISFLVQYNKEFRAVYNQRSPNGRYSERYNAYYLFKDGNIRDITSKKAFLNNFPLHKKEIKSFMRRNKIKYKKAKLNALHQLMKYCDSISTDK